MFAMARLVRMPTFLNNSFTCKKLQVGGKEKEPKIKAFKVECFSRIDDR